MGYLTKYAVFSATLLTCILLAGCHSEKQDHFVTDNRFASFSPSVDLEKDFRKPPPQARPWCFWWWIESYIDKAGIRDDLIAMKNVGIEGAIIVDARGEFSYGKQVKQTPPGPEFMSRQWRDLFKYAVKVADSLGLQLSMNITSGWNTGGPWVTPKYALKKLTWHKVIVKGPTQLGKKLPVPENVFVWPKDSLPYFWPVAALAVRLSDSSDNVTPLMFFKQKTVNSLRIPKTRNGYNWDIFLQEDSSTINQYSVQANDIINISQYVDSSGNIQWKVPDGRFAIYWFGYTNTGVKAKMHGPGGGGLTIDYMDPQAINLQLKNVPEVLINDIKSLGANSLRYLMSDSWELGAPNWTPGFIEKFKKLRGYDPTPYLPVLAGEVIDDKAVSNRFLYDFRRTIGDLIADHYARIRSFAHQHGLGVHPESGGPHPAPIDALENLGISDIPMGEFWAKVKTHRAKDYDRFFIKQSASAAHTYGRRYVQAEGPTSMGPHWELDPRRLKPTIDRAFCEGLNRLAFHTFTHSPDSVGKPGWEYHAGSHFNPNITWWDQAPAYVNYISRCQMLLQQGAFVGDVCFYYGNNVPNQVHLKRTNPSLGEGYDYDFVDTQVLLDSLFVRDHKIYLHNGMHYEVLVLPQQKTIPLKILKKIEQLVRNGATVIGPKPERTMSLTGYPDADKAVKKIAGELWGNNTQLKERKYGQGKVVWGKTIRQVLQERGIRPDFIAEGKTQLQDVDYIHRRYKEYDIYFVCNWKNKAQWFMADFRVVGKTPSLWYPDDGSIVPQKVFTTGEKFTSLPLHLPAYGSVFVVFKKEARSPHIDSIRLNDAVIYPFAHGTADTSSYFIPAKGNKIVFNKAGDYTLYFSKNKVKQFSALSVPSPDSIDGDWKVYFDTAWGGPGAITLDTLISWPESSIKGIKYYSGTAVYKNSFLLDSKELNDNLRIVLDLNTVYNLAEVKVNGRPAKTLWKYPFSTDITPYVRSGVNRIEIKVVNLWPNRIIGDLFLPADQRTTRTNIIKFTRDYPLLPSGLLGPVVIQFKPVVKLTKP